MRFHELVQRAGKRPVLLSHLRKHLYPVTVAAAVFLAYPTIVAYQDIASLLPEPIAQRWLAHVEQSPGQSAIAAQMTGVEISRVDTVNTSSIAPSGIQDTTPLKISTETGAQSEPQRINRALKSKRVVSSGVRRPPAYFSAGSVVERHSMFQPLEAEAEYELAFVQSRPIEEAMEVASFFHAPKADFQVGDDLPVVVAGLVRESANYILSYASLDDTGKRSPFAAVLESEAPIDLIPKLDEGDHSWAAEPLPFAVFAEGEQRCLTAGIYFEARGEPVKGQAAVAQVILNRVKNPSYPDTACGVVYQNKKWRNRCQFSFACDRIKDRVNDKARWEVAEHVARETTAGRIWLPEVGSSTHYHATYVSPKWARKMKRVGKIGLHIFYRTFGGGWS